MSPNVNERLPFNVCGFEPGPESKMANSKTSKYLGIIIFSIFLTASCERTKDKMYKNVNGAFCFKRLNGTQEFGCTSSRSGETGVVHIIRNETDMTWLIQEANAGPYVVVITFDFFNRDSLLKLKNSGKVSGIVLKHLNGTHTNRYSPDDSCPNRNSGLDNQCDSNNPWNQAGDSLLFLHLGFPVVYIDSKEALDFLDQCFETHNAHDLDKQSSRSLCSIELTSHMLAAVDTKTCIRKTMMFNNLVRVKYCDPLGDLSIYLPLFPRLKPEKDRSVILVTARLDGMSLFDKTVPGAKSPVTGIVSLLMTAHYLSEMTKKRPGQSSPEKNVMFMLLNGESFDYIGSSRVIYDMKNGAFPYAKQDGIPEGKQSPPLKLSNIGLIVELDEITRSEIFYHSSFTNGLIQDIGDIFLKALEVESKNLTLQLSESIKRLPPGSFQRFMKEDHDIQGVMLSSYNATFTNEYYHSILDTREKLYDYAADLEQDQETVQAVIAKVSLAVARSLYKILFDETSDSMLSPNTTLVNELLYCYLEASSCKIFRRVTFNQKLPDEPLSLYVGVHNNNNVITNLTGLALALLTGEQNNTFNQSTCQKDNDDLIYQRFWMTSENDNTTGICVISLMNFTLALSPAFEIEGYNWASGKYSSWSESLWQQFSVRIFLKPSKYHEISTLSVGLVVCIFSFVIVYFVNSKANILFNNQVLGSGDC